jgi:tetratricopeptide (TPR) repeat protein
LPISGDSGIELTMIKHEKPSIDNEKVPSNKYNIEGIAHAKKGEYHEAISCFLKAQNQNPNNPTSWYNIGTSLAMVNKEEKALFILYCYDRAIDLDPHNAEAWNNKGAILEFMGADKSALHCYQRALEIRPGYASAKHNIELLLKKKGLKSHAKQYSKDANKESIANPLYYLSFD